MFAGKAGGYPSESPFRCSTQGFSLTPSRQIRKYVLCIIRVECHSNFQNILYFKKQQNGKTYWKIGPQKKTDKQLIDSKEGQIL